MNVFVAIIRAAQSGDELPPIEATLEWAKHFGGELEIPPQERKRKPYRVSPWDHYTARINAKNGVKPSIGKPKVKPFWKYMGPVVTE